MKTAQHIPKVTVTIGSGRDDKQEEGRVLAHPVAYANEDNMTVEEVQQLINKMKPDGLEAYHIYTNRNNEYINEIDKWLKLAKDNNLFSTIDQISICQLTIMQKLYEQCRKVNQKKKQSKKYYQN